MATLLSHGEIMMYAEMHMNYTIESCNSECHRLIFCRKIVLEFEIVGSIFHIPPHEKEHALATMSRTTNFRGKEKF